MIIGILSDTHDQTARIQKAVALFVERKVGLVIHCGDIVSPFTLQLYKDLRCPVKFLFGNNTGDIFLHLQYKEKHGLSEYEFGNFFSLTLEGKRIAAYHGDQPAITEALIKCGEYDCVCAGHDHRARIERHGSVLFINSGTLAELPGSAMTPPSVAIYNTHTHEAEISLI
ncbi:MAG: metallophosphoesterase [Patescibacteria group bacterium]